MLTSKLLLPLPALSRWKIQLLSFQHGHTPIPLQDIQSLSSGKTEIACPETLPTHTPGDENATIWELRTEGFHNYAIKPGRISIKVIPWTLANLACVSLDINAQQLQPWPLVNTCKTADANTQTHVNIQGIWHYCLCYPVLVCMSVLPPCGSNDGV